VSSQVWKFIDLTTKIFLVEPEEEAFKSVSEVFLDYTKYSSIQGLIYIFSSHQVLFQTKHKKCRHILLSIIDCVGIIWAPRNLDY